MKKITTILMMTVAMFCLCSINTAKSQNTDSDTSTFVPHGSFSGYVFGDYYYKTHSDSMGRGAGNVQYRGVAPGSANGSGTNGSNPNGQQDAFQIRRAYLNFDYDISRQFSAHATLADEAGPNDGSSLSNANGNLGFPGTNLDAGGSNTVYVKYFYLKWENIFKGSNLLIGQQATPSFATAYSTEPLWGYRSIERTIMDIHNNDASSDMGVSLQGRLWHQDVEENPALIGYQIQVGNGNSAKPETDRFKKYRATLYTSFMQQKITVGVYGDYNPIQLYPYQISTTTMKVYADFKSDWFRIGAEMFMQTNKNGDIFRPSLTDTTKKNDTADGVQSGISVFLSGKICSKLNYFARYDMYNPDTKFSGSNLYKSSATGGNMNTTTFYTQTFITAGLDWAVNPRVHIMPNIWYNQYQVTSGLTDTKGNAYTGRNAKDNDFVARLTFYFIFNAAKKVANNGMNY